jgi:hypothetical protein
MPALFRTALDGDLLKDMLKALSSLAKYEPLHCPMYYVTLIYRL